MQAELTLLLQQTVQSPRVAARNLLDRNLPVGTAWLAISLMAALSACLTGVSVLAAPEQIEPNILVLFHNPLQVALLQAAVMVVMAMLIQGVGRVFGGAGRFADALLLVAWTEAILCVLQLAQIVLVVVSPGIAAALGLFGLVMFVWVLANFIAEMHGFASAGKVLFGIIGTVFAMAFMLAIVTVALMEMKG